MQEYFKLEINDYFQQISIKGDENKPILLFCHGGPGTPSMTFLKKWNQPLFDDFLLVTWDQRGTGRSFTKGLNLDTLNINQIITDTHVLTTYLKSRFKVDKIYIMGHSFGATMALQVIKEQPENYMAYFGVSQFVNTAKNEAECYRFVMAESLKQGDGRIRKKLKAIGEPINGYYQRPIKDLVFVKRLISKYHGDTKNSNSTLSILIDILLSKEYGFFRAMNSIKGIGISIEKIGLSLKGIAYDKTHLKLDIPIYFFSGDYDQLTPQGILRDYFKKLDAPHKKLYEFHESAHNPLWEERDKFHLIIHEIMNS